MNKILLLATAILLAGCVHQRGIIIPTSDGGAAPAAPRTIGPDFDTLSDWMGGTGQFGIGGGCPGACNLGPQPAPPPEPKPEYCTGKLC